MEILGYILSLLIGISLGMIGSGGTIITLPILVYFFGIETIDATHYSMFVVGVTSSVGIIRKYKEKMVDFRNAFYFLVPSFISIFLTRKLLLPCLPEDISITSNIILNKNIYLLILFAVIMLYASISMIKDSKSPDAECNPKNIISSNKNIINTTIVAIMVGILTGLLGAGGGFLIVPMLIKLNNHCMKKATGTSLVIIASNSIIGFLSDIHAEIDWFFVLCFSVIAIIGMLIGIRLSNKIDGSKLKKIFGILVLAMGIYIITKELIFKI